MENDHLSDANLLYRFDERIALMHFDGNEPLDKAVIAARQEMYEFLGKNGFKHSEAVHKVYVITRVADDGTL